MPESRQIVLPGANPVASSLKVFFEMIVSQWHDWANASKVRIRERADKKRKGMTLVDVADIIIRFRDE